MNKTPKIKKTRKACFSQALVEDSDQQSTQSGAIIGSNDDLLTEILLRLPVTSILRFKSVSKHWRWLLSHTHFTHRYDRLLKSPGLFAGNEYVPFDVENPNPPPFRSFDSYFDRPGVRIVQSCNGLLLCCTNLGPKGCKAASKYYVFNPTTKQLAVIPSVPGGLKVAKTIRLMCLAYHQTECARYKVVCIRSLDSRHESFQIQIYSSDTRKWKVSIQSFSAFGSVFRHGVYWNGAVFWAPFYGNNLYFKIDVEQLQTLPLPAGLISPEIMAMYFGESRGHLHLHLDVYKNVEDNSLRVSAYEMLSDCSGWFDKYQVELDELPGAFPEMISPSGFYYYKVIDVVRGEEEEEDTFIVLKTSEKIITYNVHDKSFKHIFSYPPYTFLPSYPRYTETLTSF